MGFELLRFFNFRNLWDGELDVGAREVFLVGENGQGKTNLIEAVHLLCLGSSFREKRETALMRDQSVPTGLFGRHAAAGGRGTISLQLVRGQKKEIRVNDKLLSERRELLSEVLCVSLVQQDMGFIAGPPEERRRFFDQVLVYSDLPFLDLLRSYRQVLKSRNICLKAGQEDLLDVYDPQMASVGLEIQARRSSLVREFNAVFSPLFSSISENDEAVQIRYQPSWQGLAHPEEVTSHLGACRGRDRLLGLSTSGPHRDVFSYVLEGRDYPHFASTGQLRLCALALRIAQALFLAQRTGRKPILLLDDVLLELDPSRKKSFIARFPPYEQAFFTFLPDENFPSYRTPDTLLLTVNMGCFRR
jgi:DNA replication and repair protein RecF